MSTKRKRPWDDTDEFFEEISDGPLTLGKALCALRQCDEISQKDFAEKLGISKANLCDIEKGRKLVSPERAARWARILGYPYSSFVRMSLQDLIRQSGIDLLVKVEPNKSTRAA